MILTMDEVLRSLGGTWDLLQRRASGLRRFDTSLAGLFRSFAAVALCAPAFIVMLAGEREKAGLLTPDGDLFDQMDITWSIAGRIAATWLATPIVAVAFVALLGMGARLRSFIVVGNWSSVVACALGAAPAFFYARGLAPADLAALYGVAAMALVAHLRWFSFKVALGVSSGLALAMTALDLATEYCLAGLLV